MYYTLSESLQPPDTWRHDVKRIRDDTIYMYGRTVCLSVNATRIQTVNNRSGNYYLWV